MSFNTVDFDLENNALVIIDQTLLPEKTVFLKIDTLEAAAEAIKALRVRGAPAIGVAAAISYALVARQIPAISYEEFSFLMAAVKDTLEKTRPTAVNLFWALDTMEGILKENRGQPVAFIKDLLRDKALEIMENDIETCRKIGENGAPLFEDGFSILTHCNAGRLAAVKYGTALAPIYIGKEWGRSYRVFADETRPLLQGARLTAWELNQAGIDVTLLCDNMAFSLMQTGRINAVIVGADRIAANGDTANKIGTAPLALAAKHFNIPFYAAAPSSTFDLDCTDGSAIKIEHRAPEEVTSMWYEKQMTPSGVGVFNPAFDVTSHSYITAFITEKGVFKNEGGVFTW